jgi:hypothetical protein
MSHVGPCELLVVLGTMESRTPPPQRRAAVPPLRRPLPHPPYRAANAGPDTVVPDAPASVALTPSGQDDAFSSVRVGRSAGYDFLLVRRCRVHSIEPDGPIVRP